MPGVAQPAIQEGRYVACLIRNRVAGTKPPRPFWYWDKGDLAIVGRNMPLPTCACCDFQGSLPGLCGRESTSYFLIGFADRFFVLVQWALAFLTKRRRVRVLPE
jgi:NADH:ubiquinone reductase (H+-translocating)